MLSKEDVKLIEIYRQIQNSNRKQGEEKDKTGEKW